MVELFVLSFLLEKQPETEKVSRPLDTVGTHSNESLSPVMNILSKHKQHNRLIFWSKTPPKIYPNRNLMALMLRIISFELFVTVKIPRPLYRGNKRGFFDCCLALCSTFELL